MRDSRGRFMKGNIPWTKGKTNKWGYHTEESKKKMRLKASGENNPMYGKHPSEETLRKKSLALKGRKMPPRSEETKKKISKSMREQYGSKKRICWNKGLTKETNERVKSFSIEGGKSRKEYYKTHNIWNKGLTKEDPRVAKYVGKSIHFKKGRILPKEIEEKRLNSMPKGKNHWKHVNVDENKIIELYNQGLSTREIANLFGTTKMVILCRLKKMGIKRKDVAFGYNESLITEDGHKVRSTPELIIDNWLFHNRILHCYGGLIGDTKFRYDFYIPESNTYIEYWGLECVESYRNKTIKKLEVYKKLGLNLLSIFPKDDLHQKLSYLLEYSKNQTKLEFIR